MRVSVLGGSKKTRKNLKFFHVLLNGRELKHCAAADEERGEAFVWATHWDIGKRKQRPLWRVRGRIRILDERKDPDWRFRTVGEPIEFRNNPHGVR